MCAAVCVCVCVGGGSCLFLRMCAPLGNEDMWFVDRMVKENEKGGTFKLNNRTEGTDLHSSSQQCQLAGGLHDWCIFICICA